VIRGEQSTNADSQQLVEPEGKSVAVLIVDDDEDARDMLAVLIERAGYSVTTAANGREALDRLRTLKPELILLDVCMPVMDGPTFRQEQRRHWEWLRIPTVVMTGAAEEPVLDVAVEQALRKPVHAAQVLALVGRHCTKTDQKPNV
jgi:two-component system OmpR family response regulator